MRPYLDRAEPHRLSGLYFAAASVALALAMLALVLDPRAAAGFFYHARLVALVHLVTLGWITCSLLGALYMAAPRAFDLPIGIGRLDYGAFALVIIGIVGMVTHFWMVSFAGMAWSAATVAAGVATVVWRVGWHLHRSPHPRSRVRPIVLASVNLGVAASMGLLLGFDKADQFLPGFVLNNVFAHAHMAALGWAALMAFALVARLLSDAPPAERPVANGALAAGTLLLEAGTLGLFLALLGQSTWSIGFGVCVVAGLAAFAFHLAVVVRHASTNGRRRHDTASASNAVRLHIGGAGLWLLTAAGLGVYLLVQPRSEMALRAALAYGAAGLLGFLGQMVLAIRVQLLETGADRRQPLVAGAWTLGVAGIALGLAGDHLLSLAAGAAVVLAAVVTDAATAVAARG